MALDPVTACILCTCLLTCWPCVVPFGILPIPYPCFVVNVDRDTREDQETWKKEDPAIRYVCSNWNRSSAPHISITPSNSETVPSRIRLVSEYSRGPYTKPVNSSVYARRGDLLSIRCLDMGPTSNSNLLDEYTRTTSKDSFENIYCTPTGNNLLSEYRIGRESRKGACSGPHRHSESNKHHRKAGCPGDKKRGEKQIKEESGHASRSNRERKSRRIGDCAFGDGSCVKSVTYRSVKTGSSTETLVSSTKHIENFDISLRYSCLYAAERRQNKINL